MHHHKMSIMSVMYCNVLYLTEQEVSDQEKPKAPVIMEQPSEVITGVIGTDLTLKLKVEGEEPIRYVLRRLHVYVSFLKEWGGESANNSHYS